MAQQSVNVLERHPCEVIAAPVNAQITEIHKVKQQSSPLFPYLTQLKAVAPIAHSGAMTQKTANCVYLLAPHQQTISKPKLRLVAAMTHPRQKAKTFLVTQVHMLYDFQGRSPSAYQVFNIHGTSAIKMKEHAQMAGSLPILKTMIQRELSILEKVNHRCTSLVHQFFIRLQMFTIAKAVQITAQIEKNSPGGVTYR